MSTRSVLAVAATKRKCEVDTDTREKKVCTSMKEMKNASVSDASRSENDKEANVAAAAVAAKEAKEGDRNATVDVDEDDDDAKDVVKKRKTEKKSGNEHKDGDVWSKTTDTYVITCTYSNQTRSGAMQTYIQVVPTIPCTGIAITDGSDKYKTLHKTSLCWRTRVCEEDEVYEKDNAPVAEYWDCHLHNLMRGAHIYIELATPPDSAAITVP
jgi:hypothetical protein